jgi:membrane protein
MQSALNTIWKVTPEGTTVSRLIRARIASLGLVAALGFMLLVSLVVSAMLSALGDYANSYLPFGKIILFILSGIVSFALISILFAAIYKILPDKNLEWRDVIVGAIATSLLFTIGKSLIGLYLGSSAVASTYGAAAALMVVLLWTYYSSQNSCWERNSPRFMPTGTAARRQDSSQPLSRYQPCDAETANEREEG